MCSSDLDIELSLTVAGGARSASPGYASLHRDAVVIGSAARAESRLHPRHSGNRFWMHLGTTPLVPAHPRVRHHADLAWMHLQHVHELGGKPRELVLAVPGSMEREQLAILLGIVQRCDFRAVGLVDAAVAAACSTATGERALHVDLQLHQCVITELAREDGVLVRQQVQVLADAGLAGLQARWAKLVAAAFIRQSRFDPSHAAAAEQQVYDLMPQWMRSLDESASVEAEIRTGNVVHRATLQSGDFLAAAAPVFDAVAAAAAALPRATVLLAPRFSALARAGSRLPGSVLLDADSLARNCLEHLDLIRSDGAALRFVTRLPAGAPGHLTEDSAPAPTHLVAGHRALRLHGPSLHLVRNVEGTWQLVRDRPPSAEIGRAHV